MDDELDLVVADGADRQATLVAVGRSFLDADVSEGLSGTVLFLAQGSCGVCTIAGGEELKQVAGDQLWTAAVQQERGDVGHRPSRGRVRTVGCDIALNRLRAIAGCFPPTPVELH